MRRKEDGEDSEKASLKRQKLEKDFETEQGLSEYGGGGEGIKIQQQGKIYAKT